MRSMLLALALTFPTITQAVADYDGKIVGNWIITAKEDRFGDGGTFAAITGDAMGMGLAVRCIQKDLSIGIVALGSDPKPLHVGDLFDLKFRVDKKPAVSSMGKAITERLIHAVTEKSLVRDIRDGRETALRVETTTGVVRTTVFKNTGAKKAFEDLQRECPLD